MDATFYTNSFNRLVLLQNLLRSFEVCNLSPNIEWVITDFGSTDGSREWLEEYAGQSSFPVSLIFADEADFFSQLQLPEIDRRARFETVLRVYRNMAREKARGKFVFDIATDHQFIRKADFVSEVRDIVGHREQVFGQFDLSGIVTFGYFRNRLDKPNNAREDVLLADETPYFLAKGKPYVDYCVMQKDVIEKVGPYLDLRDISKDDPRMQQWITRDDAIRPETEYMQRCETLGLRRAFLKYPFQVSFTNAQAKEIISNVQSRDDLLVPLWSMEELRARFGWLNRPVSSDELLRGSSPSMVSRLFHYAKLWVS